MCEELQISANRPHPAKRSRLRALGPIARLVSMRLEYACSTHAQLGAFGMGGFDEIWRIGGGRIVARHRDRSVVRIEVESGIHAEALYIKRLGRAHFKDIFESILSLEWPLSKCLREWKYARLLKRAGVSGPAILAAGEFRLGPMPLESLLVVREIEGARSLGDFLSVGSGFIGGHADRRALAEAVAETVASMHSAGLFHQDLYAKHIFVRRRGGGFAINIIDLQRMKRSRRESLAAKDLAALNVTLPREAVSQMDRLRFLVAYASRRWGGHGASKARRLLKRVLKRSHHIGGRRKFRGIRWCP